MCLCGGECSNTLTNSKYRPFFFNPEAWQGVDQNILKVYYIVFDFFPLRNKIYVHILLIACLLITKNGFLFKTNPLKTISLFCTGGSFRVILYKTVHFPVKKNRFFYQNLQ
jgi:hypothetical protein